MLCCGPWSSSLGGHAAYPACLTVCHAARHGMRPILWDLAQNRNALPPALQLLCPALAGQANNMCTHLPCPHPGCHDP